MSSQRQEVFRIASERFEQSPDWVCFFREVLGVDGIVRRMHPDPMALAEFEQYRKLTGEDKPVSSWIAELRRRTGVAAPPSETKPVEAAPPPAAAPAPADATSGTAGAAPEAAPPAAASPTETAPTGGAK